MLLLTIVLGAVCLWNTHLFSTRPFASEYEFDGPSGAFRGSSGGTYVVDAARKEILILNQDLEYVRTIQGGSTADGEFYYATAVTDGPDGIYVADALYAGTGTIVQAERILRYEPDGSGGEVLYQIDYPDPGTAPRQYGRIKSLMLDGNELLFTTAEENRVRVYAYDLVSGTVETTAYDFGSSYVSFSALDPATGRPVIIAGDTTIRTIDADGTVRILAETNAFPYQLTVTQDGTVWYSELNTGSLMRVGENGETECVSDEVYAYYVSSCENVICISDGSGLAVWQDGEMMYSTGVSIANAAVRNVMWLLLGIGTLALLALLVVAARFIIRRWLSYPFFRKIAVVILIAVVAASAVSWYMLYTTFQREDETVMAQLDEISDTIVAETDVSLLRKVRSAADYKSDAFDALKEKLDAVINDGYERGEYFYYLTYVTDGELIYGLMDYEDTVRTWMTYEAYGVEGYTDVFETGEPLLLKGEVSTWGAWTLILKPVFDEDGHVAAVQEVGFNYDNQLMARRETIANTILTIAFGAIVLVMLIIEGIYFSEHQRKKREVLQRVDAVDLTDLVPLRTLIFLAFTVDCMQDAFISILATQLYKPFLGIPQSVGAALPISGQVLMAAICAVLGGFAANRLGTKRVICLGFLLQASGFLICGVTLRYFGILLGKLLVGAGIGLISVGVNTTAAASTDESKSVAAFTGITAGTLAGVSAGSGLGSTILSLVGYRAVFFTGAVILLAAFALTMTVRYAAAGTAAPPKAVDAPSPKAESGHSMGIGKFLFGKGGTLPFLAMVLTPFMVAIYFREYFFPIYAAENGVTETNIGRLYVLCGLLVIYGGPSLTKYLMEKLGGIGTVVLTSGLIALGSLSFGLLPTMVGAIIGVVLVSVAISSGYTAQSSYYSALPAVSEFGEGRAMGIYSLFDNGGQTLGSIIYGSAMLLGYQTGMLYVGGALALLTASFAAVKRRELRRRKGRPSPQEEITC